ncbi:ROK family protein [Polyangium jinanense]|uniref:ROK family protein n=1 Tax=Polyangium jinanense TaxID=2829994 RepID=A0A9X4ARA4_9BACT|nr:ROK family protein [Polyangium jinanense]MDC3954155.1 ROK family protein [Polyangium jinanense]MDC3981889.1 ROK family protein [Polyangium jinanense]
MRQPIAIGVDLGGTKIEAVVLREAEKAAPAVDLRRRIPTPRERGYEGILEAVATLVRDVAAEAGLDAKTIPLGVGMPGGVTGAGLVKNSNTTCLNGGPFRPDLERLLDRSIAFDNDANCFALAEARLGAAAAYVGGVVFGVILGTGVGGGLVIRGQVWPGEHGIAGEWGHHAVFPDRGPVCYCGHRGCLELFASGPAVEADYARRAGRSLSASEIAARRAEDIHAAAAIEGLLEAFARGLANVIDIVDPTAIVLGGGLSNLNLLYDEGRDRVAAIVFNDELRTPILKNKLGDSAGVIGAALLAI